MSGMNREMEIWKEVKKENDVFLCDSDRKKRGMKARWLMFYSL